MRQILVASTVLVLGAATIPQYLQSRLGSSPDAQPGNAARPVPVAVSADHRDTRIKAARDGHFYVEADINLRPVRLMVDTGASIVALRESDAARAGLRVRPADFTIPISTANGTAYAAPVELDSVSVADVEVANVRAVVLPDRQLGVSLLGATYLNRLARFEVANGTLIFEK